MVFHGGILARPHLFTLIYEVYTSTFALIALRNEQYASTNRSSSSSQGFGNTIISPFSALDSRKFRPDMIYGPEQDRMWYR